MQRLLQESRAQKKPARKIEPARRFPATGVVSVPVFAMAVFVAMIAVEVALAVAQHIVVVPVVRTAVVVATETPLDVLDIE
jgi:hypothetical protein